MEEEKLIKNHEEKVKMIKSSSMLNDESKKILLEKEEKSFQKELESIRNQSNVKIDKDAFKEVMVGSKYEYEQLSVRLESIKDELKFLYESKQDLENDVNELKNKIEEENEQNNGYSPNEIIFDKKLNLKLSSLTALNEKIYKLENTKLELQKEKIDLRRKIVNDNAKINYSNNIHDKEKYENELIAAKREYYQLYTKPTGLSLYELDRIKDLKEFIQTLEAKLGDLKHIPNERKDNTLENNAPDSSLPENSEEKEINQNFFFTKINPSKKETINDIIHLANILKGLNPKIKIKTDISILNPLDSNKILDNIYVSCPFEDLVLPDGFRIENGVLTSRGSNENGEFYECNLKPLVKEDIKLYGKSNETIKDESTADEKDEQQKTIGSEEPKKEPAAGINSGEEMAKEVFGDDLEKTIIDEEPEESEKHEVIAAHKSKYCEDKAWPYFKAALKGAGISAIVSLSMASAWPLVIGTGLGLGFKYLNFKIKDLSDKLEKEGDCNNIGFIKKSCVNLYKWWNGQLEYQRRKRGELKSEDNELSQDDPEQQVENIYQDSEENEENLSEGRGR